jgi:hypothetical protein
MHSSQSHDAVVHVYDENIVALLASIAWFKMFPGKAPVFSFAIPSAIY